MLRWLAASLLCLAALGCSDDTEEPPPSDDEWKEAFAASSEGWLLSVWGPSPTSVYAMGGQPGEGRLHHFDGSAWKRVELPAGTPLLTWAYGFSDADITFVGDAGAVLHFDGSAFTAQTTPTTENLWGVWGPAPNDLYAVGGSGRSGGVPTLLHYDGAAWATVTLPALQKANVNALFKVWGTSATNVYAVGQRGTVLHFDGIEWTEELVGASDDLISIWGTDASHVYAVGGRGNGIMSRFDGTEWHTESLAPLPALNGVFTRTPDVVHVVGITGTIAVVDGKTLKVVESKPWSTTLDLHATFGAGDTLFAVGGSLASTQAPFEGIALQRGLLTEE